MKVLIVFSHPSKNSYTYQILTQLKSALDKAQICYELSDLYSMGFQTDMSEAEYEREGFAKTEISISDDVQAEHRKIENADCIIFLYPVWWSDCPAKLKGWFDRVYSVGYAYGYDKSDHSINKMKQVPYGFVICTAGHPNDFLDEIGIAESMRNVMIDDRLGQRFKHKEMHILGGTLEKEKVRPVHYQKIMHIVKTIEDSSNQYD